MTRNLIDRITGMNLGIVLPSNNPVSFFANMAPTLRYLRSGLHCVNIKLLICAQQPWVLDYTGQAQELAANVDIEVRLVMRPADMPPRMCALRQAAAALWPEADVYMLADDNMRFSSHLPMSEEFPEGMMRSSGERYAEVLEYMRTYPRCGLVQCHTSDPLRVGSSIIPTDNGLVTTNKGLFLRNIFRGEVWPHIALDFRASLEETVAGYRVLEQGYFPARQYGNPTRHTIHKIGEHDLLHSREIIMRNAGAWVRAHYNDPTWEHESGRFPPSLIERARHHGGTAVSFDPQDFLFTKVY
jgi:hypothetical protein